jgi:hypothetical protein
VTERDEQRVRTEAGWIGVEISRSRVRTPGRAGFGLYRVRTAAERHWHVPHPVVTPAGEWTAYAFTLDVISAAVRNSIGQGTPDRPIALHVVEDGSCRPGEYPRMVVVPTRWTSAYRGARTGGLADEAGAWRVVADAGLSPVSMESEGLDIALLSHSAGISSPRAETLGDWPAVSVPCADELEPDGRVCPGTIRVAAGEPQGRCDACGGWSGRFAPLTARQRQRLANGEFQREHAEARRVGLERRHAGKRGLCECGRVQPEHRPGDTCSVGVQLDRIYALPESPPRNPPR